MTKKLRAQVRAFQRSFAKTVELFEALTSAIDGLDQTPRPKRTRTARKTVTAVDVLGLVALEGPLSPSEVQRQLELTPGQAKGLLRRLKGSGQLVTKQLEGGRVHYSLPSKPSNTNGITRTSRKKQEHSSP